MHQPAVRYCCDSHGERLVRRAFTLSFFCSCCGGISQLKLAWCQCTITRLLCLVFVFGLFDHIETESSVSHVCDPCAVQALPSLLSSSFISCLRLFLPPSLSLMEELDCSCNELESLPPTIGYLHSLRTFAADENFLTELPREVRWSTRQAD